MLKTLRTTFCFLCLLIAGVSSAWGDEIESNFESFTPLGTDLKVGTGELGWTASVKPTSFDTSNGRGFQWSKTAVTLTAKQSLSRITKVVVTASTNGTGNAIVVKIGSTTLSPSSASLSNGDKNKEFEFTTTALDGTISIIKSASADATKSFYIKKIVVTYNPVIPITSISGMASTATIEVDGTTTLTPTVLPDNTTETVVWESSNEAVATVSNGVVTGVAPGVATITAKSPSDASIKAICEVTVNAATTVATPTLSLAEGTYNEAQSVTLNCLTDDAVIRYTTDGTDPTSSSTVYSSAISVDRSMTIKAKAFKDGLADSDIASATYTLKCIAPTFTPGASTLVYGFQITLSTSTDGATIYYTTNGNTPTTSSTVYDNSNKPAINNDQTIKAIAAKDGWSDSDVNSAAYELKTPDDPTFSLASGMVIKGSTLTLSSEAGTTIRFTTDGTTPTASVGTIYTEPIAINEAQTIKAVAYDAGNNLSNVITKAYTVLVGEIVTFDASTDKGTSLSKNGVSFRTSATESDVYKFYKSSTTTFTVTSGKIKRIGFYGVDGYAISNMTASTGTLNTTSSPNGIWTGNATSVTFTASVAQARATMIKVYVAKTATPTFSVTEGEYDAAQNVTLSCTTDGATIYYTTNGNKPTSSSTEYTGPISITETQTLKAIAIYDDVESAVASATYTMNRPAAPTFDKAEGIFDAAFDLHLTAVDGAVIYYTTNGEEPTTSSTVYDTKIAIPASTTTVKAIAVKNGLTSDVATVTYTYDTRPAPSFTLSDDEMTILVMSDDQTITLTTNSDGAVTFTSSDDSKLDVDNSVDSKVGVLTALEAGDYTVTVSTAATANFLAGEGTVTVHVVKKATTMTINTDFSDGTDLKDASTGLIEGIVKYNDAALSPQPTVTYTSSNTSVATIDADGEVTFIKAGTTTLTASFAGNDEYEECEAEYELTLIDTTPQKAEVTINLNSTTFETTAPDGVELTVEKITITPNTGSASNDLLADATCIRMYKNSNMVVTAPSGYCLTSISFEEPSSSTKWDGEPTTNVGSYESKVWTGSANSVTFTFSGGQCRIASATITLAPIVTISTAGLATYASDFALDYTDVEGIEAYIAKEEAGTVKLHQVNKVPAGTGVLLRSTNSGTEFVVPITTADPDDVSGNIFVRGTGAPVASVADGKNNYILNEIGGVLGFYKANDKMVATNRAYLQTIVASARIALDFDDETTGINNVNHNHNDNWYDMQGRKVDAPKKGLYIINGRKVVIK